MYLGIALLLIFERFGLSSYGIIIWIMTLLLTAIARNDRDSMIIPNRFVAGLLFLVPFSAWLAPEVSIGSRVIGALAVSIPMFLLTVWIPGCFGGGDIKLIGVSGLLLGWQGTFLATYLAVLTGGIYGIYLLSTKKIARGGHFAFGPFLAFGIWISLLYQGEVVEWYLEFF